MRLLYDKLDMLVSRAFRVYERRSLALDTLYQAVGRLPGHSFAT